MGGPRTRRIDAVIAALVACASGAAAADRVPLVRPPLAEVIEAARADAARRSGLAAGAFEVIEARAVTWPDGSLGCPQPGMMYVQVITPGYQVVFDVDGVQYDIRASAQGGALLCEPGSPAPG